MCIIEKGNSDVIYFIKTYNSAKVKPCYSQAITKYKPCRDHSKTRTLAQREINDQKSPLP